MMAALGTIDVLLLLLSLLDDADSLKEFGVCRMVLVVTELLGVLWVLEGF